MRWLAIGGCGKGAGSIEDVGWCVFDGAIPCGFFGAGEGFADFGAKDVGACSAIGFGFVGQGEFVVGDAGKNAEKNVAHFGCDDAGADFAVKAVHGISDGSAVGEFAEVAARNL